MSTTATAPTTATTTETPAVATTAPATATPPVKEPEFNAREAMDKIDLEHLSTEDAAALESGDPERLAAVLKLSTPAKAAEAAKGDTTTAKPEDKSGKRVRLNALKDAEQMVVIEMLEEVRTGKFATFEAAMAARVAAAMPATTTTTKKDDETAPAAETTTTTTAPDAEVARIEQEIKDVEAKLEEAQTATFDPKIEAECNRTLARLDYKLEKAKEQAETLADAQKSFLAKETESKSAAIDLLPDLAEGDSKAREHFDDEFYLAERKSDPILNSPDWPVQIANRVKEKYFGGSAHSQHDGDSQQPIPPAPNSRVRLPGSPLGQQSASGNVSAQVAMQEFDAMPLEQRQAVLEAMEKKQR